MGTEAVEVVVEEVASNLEEVASAARQLNTSGVGYLIGGLLIGGGIGFYVGYKLSKKKLRAEAFAEAEEEIEQIRELYRRKTVAAEGKPALDEVVEELGYVSYGGTRNTGTSELVIEDETNRPLRAPVPMSSMPVPTAERPTPTPVEVEIEMSENGEVKVTKDPNEGWNQARENDNRSSNLPYVIHQDEYGTYDPDYNLVVFTYYDSDEVMVDTADNKPVTDPESVVGANNLKWGHGSSDGDVVFVRNDRLELDIQIFRNPKSYEEEVLGLENGVDSHS